MSPTGDRDRPVPDRPAHDEAARDEAARDEAARDEAVLQEHARRLLDEVGAAFGPYLRARTRALVGTADLEEPGALAEELEAAIDAASAQALARLDSLLCTDIDAQRDTPLSVLRAAVARPTEVLLGAGVAPVDRDEHDRHLLPGDHYALAPIAFADLGEGVGEAGLMWGAAKAHVHLRRRRDDGLR